MIASLNPQDIPVGWLIVGFVGQGVFAMRFIVQWIATERAKKVVIPLAFWYLSLGGTLVTMAYAIFRSDPVFIASFSLNTIIYVRNLYFIHIHPRKLATRAAASEMPTQEDE